MSAGLIGKAALRMSLWHAFLLQLTIARNKSVPWMSQSVLLAIRKRKKLFQTFKRTGNLQDHVKYKTQRNTVVSLLRQSKETFFCNLNSASAKEFWKAVKHLNENKNTTIPTLSDGQSSVSSNIGKAELLNNYFYSCFNRKCPPLSSTCSSTNHSLTLDPQKFPKELLCPEETIVDFLMKLDVTISTGVDDISARMLKYCAYSIAPSLTKFFNLSLISSTFPSEWKVARIVPIPKTDSPSVSASDYQPISILPVVSKVLERHVKRAIYSCQWIFIYLTPCPIRSSPGICTWSSSIYYLHQ